MNIQRIINKTSTFMKDLAGESLEVSTPPAVLPLIKDIVESLTQFNNGLRKLTNQTKPETPKDPPADPPSEKTETEQKDPDSPDNPDPEAPGK